MHGRRVVVDPGLPGFFGRVGIPGMREDIQQFSSLAQKEVGPFWSVPQMNRPVEVLISQAVDESDDVGERGIEVFVEAVRRIEHRSEVGNDTGIQMVGHRVDRRLCSLRQPFVDVVPDRVVLEVVGREDQSLVDQEERVLESGRASERVRVERCLEQFR